MLSQDTFIIGIDFGTTYSAAAWALSSDPGSIEVIKKWPTFGQPIGTKVPTEIAYAKDGSVSWGYDISPYNTKIKWFKLALETTEDVISLPVGMSAVNVARDYLKELYRHVITVLLRQFSPAKLAQSRYEIVLTVPAIWSDSAKMRTQTAATAAFGPNSKIALLSEPESAAIYTLKSIERYLYKPMAHDKILICDAGGGTVDLISYTIKQTGPLKLEECTKGTGDFCGASFIDRAFEKFLERRLGAAYDSLSIVHRQQVMKNFELSKMSFTDSENKAQFCVYIPNIANLPSAGIVDHQLQISREEMRALFDPVVEKVLLLVKEQVRMACSSSRSMAAILLVGWFGESEYLYLRIKAWASSLSPSIEVLQPKDAATAVVQGAVLKASEAASSKTVHVARRARRCYGVPTKEIFVEGVHLEKDAEWDAFSGLKVAKNQVRWFIKANQIVDDEEQFRFGFRRTFQRITRWEDSLVTCHLDDPPTRMEPGVVSKHCTISSDMTHLKLKDFPMKKRAGKQYHTAHYELVIGLQNNNLDLSLLYGSVKYGVANVQFDQADSDRRQH